MRMHSLRTLAPRRGSLWLAFVTGLLAAVVTSVAVASISLHRDTREGRDDHVLPPSVARVLVMKDGVRVHLPANFYFYNAPTEEHPEAVVIARGDPAHPASSASWDYSGQTPTVLEWNVADADEVAFAKIRNEISATPPDDYVYDPQPGELYQEAPTPSSGPPTDPTFPSYEPQTDLSVPSTETRHVTVLGVPVDLPPGFTVIDVHVTPIASVDDESPAEYGTHRVWIQARSSKDDYQMVIAQIGWDADTGAFLGGDVPPALDDTLGKLGRDVNRGLNH